MIRCSFKFDGRVQVNASFETNVEFVYAAGPAAEFTRVDCSAAAFVTSSHARYSSAEIGARAADALMRRLDVSAVGWRPMDSAYSRPLAVRCRLPGGHNYLWVAAPCHPVSEELAANTLLTDDPVNGFFEIVVDRRGRVLELSCYSKMVSLFRGKIYEEVSFANDRTVGSPLFRRTFFYQY